MDNAARTEHAFAMQAGRAAPVICSLVPIKTVATKMANVWEVIGVSVILVTLE